jgi:hypothetical protein
VAQVAVALAEPVEYLRLLLVVAYRVKGTRAAQLLRLPVVVVLVEPRRLRLEGREGLLQ